MSQIVKLKRIFRRNEDKEVNKVLSELRNMQRKLIDDKNIYIDIFRTVLKTETQIIVTFAEPILTADECLHLIDDLSFEEV